MLDRLLGKKDKEDKDNKEKRIVIEGQDDAVDETMSLLVQEDKTSVTEVMGEVESAVKEAAKESLRDLKLLEEGRCPECGRKIRQFLFTSVCTNCGWSTYIAPEEGHAIVHLKNRETFQCGMTFDTREGDILCVTNEVVTARIPKANVSFVECVWTENDIRKRKEQKELEATVLCSWCEKRLKKTDEEATTTYAALGPYQERYNFCAEKCEQAFQKQYPARVHRNCYDRSCLDCNECLKRYDASDESILKRKDFVRGQM